MAHRNGGRNLRFLPPQGLTGEGDWRMVKSFLGTLRSSLIESKMQALPWTAASKHTNPPAPRKWAWVFKLLSLAALGGLAEKWLGYTGQSQNWALTDSDRYQFNKISWGNCSCINQKKFLCDRLNTFNRIANILAGWVRKNTLNWAIDYPSSRLDLRVDSKDAELALYGRWA